MSDEQSLLIRFLEHMNEQEGHGPSIPSVCVMHHQGRRKLFVEVYRVDDPQVALIPGEFEGMPTKIVPYIDSGPYRDKAKEMVRGRLKELGLPNDSHVPVEVARELLGADAWRVDRMKPDCYSSVGHLYRGRVHLAMVPKLMREADAYRSWEIDPVAA